MSKFKQAVLRQMETIPKGYFQAQDRLMYEVEAREGRQFFAPYWRLARLAKKGVIRRGRGVRSIFSSYNGTPNYGPTTGGDDHE